MGKHQIKGGLVANMVKLKKKKDGQGRIEFTGSPANVSGTRQLRWSESTMVIPKAIQTVKTAQEYVKWFGPGALCFMHGCGESLTTELAAIGVMS
jgi:hypothetical protein